MIKSMGVVFGDIGTSPIYTLTVIFLLVQPTIGNLVGIVSLIIWTLIILVTIQYAVLAMQLGKRGEDGTIVLRETLVPLLKSSRSIGIISILSIIGAFVLLVDIIFLLSTTLKIPNGGYWSLIIASFPFAMIMIYISGQKRLFAAMHPMDLNEFLERYERVYCHVKKIKGTTLFFARDVQKIPAYISHTIFNNNILYEENIIISIQILDRPFGVKWKFEDELAPALRVFSISYGYMEVISMTKILEEAGIREKTIFYGLEEIVSDNIVWKLFSVMKRLAPPFVQYYKLPSHKIHGVVTRIEM